MKFTLTAKTSGEAFVNPVTTLALALEPERLLASSMRNRRPEADSWTSSSSRNSFRWCRD
jgi:hypothetical protein